MATPVVTVLGTGTMGAGMVRSLRRADVPVRVWNRDPAKARALTDTGADAFDAPAEAVDGADVVLTMLLDADAVLDVVRQAAPAAGTVWLQTSTVGLEGADRTVAAARELDLVLVDCPVLGTKEPAEKGRWCCWPRARRRSARGWTRCSTRSGRRPAGSVRPGPAAG